MMVDSFYVVILTVFIFPVFTFSGLNAVTATEEEDNSNIMIQLGVTEQQEEVYRWSNDSGSINPTLEFEVNTDNAVQIQNPTDEEHEMIVESQPGNELATSGDIEPDSSGELLFRPNMTGTLQYYCQYHPSTMRGIIEVTDS
jgi:plastocyanin